MEQAVLECPICASSAIRNAGTHGKYLLGRCVRCDHLFVTSEVPVEALSTAYDESYYKGDRVVDESPDTLGYRDYLGNVGRRLEGFRQRLAQVQSKIQPPGRLLDFGCALGLFVHVAATHGWDAIGYDHSEWAARTGKERFGVEILSGDLPTFDAASFDVVTIWDALEHLPDPALVLRQVAKWLRPGGLLALNTVNSSSLGAKLAGQRWRHIAPPFHLNLFSRASLRRLLADTGYSISWIGAEGLVFGAAQDAPPLAGISRIVDETVTYWRFKPLTTRLNLFDEISVLATRS